MAVIREDSKLLIERSVFLECVSMFPRITLSVGECSSLCVLSSATEERMAPQTQNASLVSVMLGSSGEGDRQRMWCLIGVGRETDKRHGL